MIKNIGNCSTVIDWNRVIEECASNAPEYIGPSHKRGDNLPGLNTILDIWDDAGYVLEKNGGTVSWDMFIPGKQFDERVLETFANYYNLDKITSAWISRIHPGRFAPIHWDVHDDEEQLDDRPKYHCHIGKPQWGHIFVVGDNCLYNQPQGTTYRWESRRLWHAGTNCGLVPKYLFNLW